MRQEFSTTYEDFIGSLFQPCEMASYIGAVREENAIKIFSLPNRKIALCVSSLCAKCVISCPKPVNISTRWKKLRSVLSILDRMQWAKKPSHATFPLIYRIVARVIFLSETSFNFDKTASIRIKGSVIQNYGSGSWSELIRKTARNTPRKYGGFPARPDFSLLKKSQLFKGSR